MRYCLFFFGGMHTDEYNSAIKILLDLEVMIKNNNINLDKFQEGLNEISNLMLKVILKKFPHKK